MLNNDKLIKRLFKIFKELKDKWGLTRYRIAVETNIPHSSLKYMMDDKFEWKLNHLLSIVDFLNRNNAKTSLKDLFDFDNKKSLSDIIDFKNADFRDVFYRVPLETRIKKPLEIKKPANPKAEAEELIKDITEAIKDNTLFKNHKITLGLKISDKNFDFKKELKFDKGKKA
jgi:hypothetical protein